MCISLLGLRLLPIMLRTAEKHHTNPRIVVVSSEVHYWAKLDEDVYNSPNGFVKFGKLEYPEYGILSSLSKLLINKKFRVTPSRYGDTKCQYVICSHKGVH